MKKNNQDKGIKRFTAILVIIAVTVSVACITYALLNKNPTKDTNITFSNKEYSELNTDTAGVIKTTINPQTISISMGGKEHGAGLSLTVHSVKMNDAMIHITAGYSMSDAITGQRLSGALANKIMLTEPLPAGNYKVKLNMINLGSVTVKPDWTQTGSIYVADFTID